jgi:hypothetical protein
MVNINFKASKTKPEVLKRLGGYSGLNYKNFILKQTKNYSFIGIIPDYVKMTNKLDFTPFQGGKDFLFGAWRTNNRYFNNGNVFNSTANLGILFQNALKQLDKIKGIDIE